MGKHPGEFIGYLAHLPSLEEHVLLEEIIDKRPVAPTRDDERYIVRLLSVAKGCIQASPEDRPTMQQVYQTQVRIPCI
ncbi:hypothetical protein BAE44_0021712 [Dichanthelium oligosanthes]|uniref:Serine-threonine/tyrosine-protein kinase catalytic domain-containing protein n=1 Tax=Dichanthelium oligosanthes TaxID=888268 RepID=A0A1E5UWQ2_9POAL|nr:hypothetical protein BAE44_0021712 [Dichanthelium oligosanthes]